MEKSFYIGDIIIDRNGNRTILITSPFLVNGGRDVTLLASLNDKRSL
jgi:hypothetical protein